MLIKPIKLIDFVYFFLNKIEKKNLKKIAPVQFSRVHVYPYFKFDRYFEILPLSTIECCKYELSVKWIKERKKMKG